MQNSIQTPKNKISPTIKVMGTQLPGSETIAPNEPAVKMKVSLLSPSFQQLAAHNEIYQ